MSETPETKQPETKSGKGASVFTYLAIMFAAAFLMLLLAYFIQQRNNEVAMDGLKDSISSFESLDELLEDNRQLRDTLEATEQELTSRQEEAKALAEELEALKESYAQLEEELRKEQDTSSAAQDYLASWNDYWAIEQFYQAEEYDACAQAIKTLQHSTYYTTPEAAQSRANEIWDALADMGLLTEEDAFANTFRYIAG